MCIAIYKPADTFLSFDTLKTCWINNPHGAGFMYAENGKLIVRKGFMYFKKFLTAYRDIEHNAVCLHFRVSTSGGINQKMTHPFNVNENLALIHNGIFPINVPTYSMKSDTALFTEMCQKFPADFYKRVTYIDWLEGWMEDGAVMHNKVVFMDNEGYVQILGLNYGNYEDDVWYSNYSYLR